MEESIKQKKKTEDLKAVIENIEKDIRSINRQLRLLIHHISKSDSILQKHEYLLKQQRSEKLSYINDTLEELGNLIWNLEENNK